MGPDILGGIGRGVATGNALRQFQRGRGMDELFAQHGPGILAGDQNALRALAQVDPMAAFRVQSDRESMGLRRQEFDMRAKEYAATLDARTAAKEAEELRKGLTEAAYYYQRGDKVGYQGVLTKHGLDPREYPFEQFEAVAPMIEGVIGTLEGHAKRAAGPQSEYEYKDGQWFELAPGRPPSVANVPGTQPGMNSEAEREIARLMSIGIPRQVAIRIKEGVYKLATDPTTGKHAVIDMTTGQTVQSAQQPPEQQPPDQPGYSFGDKYENTDSAFGLPGIGAWAANSVADTIGAPVPFPSIMTTQADFAALREQLVNDISSGYQRQPPSWLLRNIQDLVPSAGGALGPEGAKSKLSALGRSLQSELAGIKRQMQTPMRETRRQELEGKAIALETAMARVDEALKSFDGGAGDVPKSFIDSLGSLDHGLTPQDVWNNMTPEGRALWQN